MAVSRRCCTTSVLKNPSDAKFPWRQAVRRLLAPSPQPISRTLSPGWGARSSNTGAPRSVTKRALLAYPSAFHVCADISGTLPFTNCTQGRRNAYEPAVNGRITRDLYRKCSGEESRSERRTSVRSTFDKAVCSEPLAFAADAGLWGLNGRYGLGRVWKR